MDKRVVVTGMGIWSCLGTDVDTVKQSLLNNSFGFGGTNSALIISKI